MGNFESPEAFVRKLAALIERALDAAHAAVSDIGSIGIGIPGAVGLIYIKKYELKIFTRR